MRIRKTLREFSLAPHVWFRLRQYFKQIKVSQKMVSHHYATRQPITPSYIHIELIKRLIAMEKDKTVSLYDDEHLASKLNVPLNEIKDAQEEMARNIFKPYAVVTCELSRPTSITMYGLSGGDRQRIMRFPEPGLFGRRKLEPEDFSAYALENLPEEIDFMGKSTGYIVNYAHDYSTEYDLKGNVIGEQDERYRVDSVCLKVKS